MPSIEIETSNVAARRTRAKSGSRKARPQPITSASVGAVLRILRRASRGWDAPVLTLMAAERHDPFRTLIGCILSLRTKARVIQDICRDLLGKFGGRVPDEIDELLTLKGVGRKTANLVVTEAFGKPGICVDTPVHRISNRWGLVRTKTPEHTEAALRKVLPRRYWLGYNSLLVAFGQTICQPVSPWCSRCPIEHLCPRIGVTHSR